jgi:hypothetical protein
MLNFDDDQGASRWDRKGFELINVTVATLIAGRLLMVFLLVLATWGVATFAL